MIPEIKCDLPQDKAQIPDIIISLFTNSKFSSKEYHRVAYLRIPVTSADITANKPKWYALKSISNNLDPSVHSYILLNISLRMNVGNQDIPRIPIRRNIKQSFIFASFLYSGFNIDPESRSEDVEANVKVRIAHYERTLLNRKIGRNPIWNELLMQIVEVDENLEFASNIIISVENPRKKLLGIVNLYTSSVGEICVSALNCKTTKDPSDPSISDFTPSFQYYHIMKDGCSQGRIFAAFHLYKLPKKKNDFDPNEFRRAVDLTHDSIVSKIEFAFVGVRNLPTPVQNPKLLVKISIDPKFDRSQLSTYEQIKENSFIEAVIEPKIVEFEGTSKLGTQNPNFLQLYSKEIVLPKDWRFYPLIEIDFLDNGFFGSNYRTEIEIFGLVTWLSANEHTYAKNSFENGKKPPLEEEEVRHDELLKELNEKDIKITISEEKIPENDSKKQLIEENKDGTNEKCNN